MELTQTELEARRQRALSIIPSGSYDGAHHKTWVIDQVLRALTGCPMERVDKLDYQGRPFSYERQGTSEEYEAWVKEFEDGSEGPQTYEWDAGIAP